MKKFLSILLIFLTSIVLTACTKEKQPKSLLEQVIKKDKITVGVKADAKPFGFKDENGNLQGFDVDLAHRIAKFLLGSEEKVEFVEVTPANRIITLTSGKVDMIIATMSVTPQRKQIVNFSTPYYIAGQAIMTDKKADIFSINDIKDKKVIVILGTTGERKIKQIAPEAIIQGYKTYTEAYNALKNGEGDALTTDDTILAGFAMDDSNMKILSKRYTQEPYAIAFRQEPESETLQSNVNEILNRMRQNGELNKLKNKWVKF